MENTTTTAVPSSGASSPISTHTVTSTITPAITPNITPITVNVDFSPILIPLYLVLAALIILIICEIYRIYDFYRFVKRRNSYARKSLRYLELIVKSLSKRSSSSPSRSAEKDIERKASDENGTGDNNVGIQTPMNGHNNNNSGLTSNQNKPEFISSTPNRKVDFVPRVSGENTSGSMLSPMNGYHSNGGPYSNKPEFITSTPNRKANCSGVGGDGSYELQQLNAMQLMPKISPEHTFPKTVDQPVTFPSDHQPAIAKYVTSVIDETFDRILSSVDPYRDYVLKQKANKAKENSIEFTTTCVSKIHFHQEPTYGIKDSLY